MVEKSSKEAVAIAIYRLLLVNINELDANATTLFFISLLLLAKVYQSLRYRGFKNEN